MKLPSKRRRWTTWSRGCRSYSTQNSLPSGSTITQSPGRSLTSRAPSSVRRRTSVGMPPTARRSKCWRFLATLPTLPPAPAGTTGSGHPSRRARPTPSRAVLSSSTFDPTRRGPEGRDHERIGAVERHGLDEAHHPLTVGLGAANGSTPSDVALWRVGAVRRTALLDRTGADHHRCPSRRRAPPAGAGRPRRRRAARRPVGGDRGPGRRPPPGAGRAAHRMGQVGGLLRGHAAAPGRGRRSDGDRLAAARADAQPDRRGRAGRHPRRHDQLHQLEQWEEIQTAVRRRRRRRPAGEPGAAQQPRLPRRGAARAWRRPAGSWSSTRPTASPTGATTSAPTTAASAPCWPSCRSASRCWRRPPPRTRA